MLTILIILILIIIAGLNSIHGYWIFGRDVLLSLLDPNFLSSPDIKSLRSVRQSVCLSRRVLGNHSQDFSDFSHFFSSFVIVRNTLIELNKKIYSFLIGHCVKYCVVMACMFLSHSCHLQLLQLSYIGPELLLIRVERSFEYEIRPVCQLVCCPSVSSEFFSGLHHQFFSDFLDLVRDHNGCKKVTGPLIQFESFNCIVNGQK